MKPVDYEIEQYGYIRTRGEIIADRLGYVLGVALLAWLGWSCLRVPE